MLEWKSRLVILLVVAASLAAVVGDIATHVNHGW
jgi:hypothetical protein